MEKVKERAKTLARPWIEPAVIIGVIIYVTTAQNQSLKSELKTEIHAGQKIIETKFESVQSEIRGVNSRIDSLERLLSRQDTEIQATDKKIDDLKNSLLSKRK